MPGKVIAFTRRSERPVVDSLSPLMKLLNANSYQKEVDLTHASPANGVFTVSSFYRKLITIVIRKNADTNDLLKVAEEICTQRLCINFSGNGFIRQAFPIEIQLEI